MDVRQHTRGRITHVVESFDPLSVLCLLTTLHAHGTWSTPFDHGNTQEDHFYMRPGQSVGLICRDCWPR